MKIPPAPSAPIFPEQRYTLKEATAFLRTSHETLYKRIRAGTVATIKDGGRRYFPGSELIRLSRVQS